MDEIIKHTLLYDFYGELLTPHQREIYEAMVFEDCSLSEVAESFEISRQGVHDLIRRCNKQLTGYEEKLHLVEKFVTAKQQVEEIRQLVKQCREDNQLTLLEESEQLLDNLLDTF